MKKDVFMKYYDAHLKMNALMVSLKAIGTEQSEIAFVGLKVIECIMGEESHWFTPFFLSLRPGTTPADAYMTFKLIVKEQAQTSPSNN